MTRQGAPFDDIAPGPADVALTPDAIKAQTDPCPGACNGTDCAIRSEILRYIWKNRSGLLARYQLVAGQGFKAVWSFGKDIVREIAPRGRVSRDAPLCVLMNLAVISQFSSEDIHVLRRNIWPFRNTVRKTEDDCKHV